jgi:hypothetical protein
MSTITAITGISITLASLPLPAGMAGKVFSLKTKALT